MTKAISVSGSIDETVAFRQGIDVVTIKDQLTGMLPKISGGSKARVVISGNAPDSEVYFDDSMVGLGPGTIIFSSSSIGNVFLYSESSGKFVELSKITTPKLFKLELSGTYTGKSDSTFRIQIVDPTDEGVYTISNPIFNGTTGLNDLNVVFEDVIETKDDGTENILIPSSSYDSIGTVNTYVVEIASAESDIADTIRWYKNGKIITPPSAEETIKTSQGNILYDGLNKIVVKFESDGFNRSQYSTVRKHTVGDSWTIIAGAQQIKWAKGTFDDTNGVTMSPQAEHDNSFGNPTGILQTGFQYLTDGIYIKLPSQLGYPDGSDSNVDPPIWEFNVVSANPESAISAMQESIGKIEIFPDHRIEQRDFGQPKLHNDFDIFTRQQRQISTVEVIYLSEIGEQNPLARTSAGNTILYDNVEKNKRNFSYDEAKNLDKKLGLPIEEYPDPLDRGWTLSSVSSDGSVGPYFTIQSLEEKYKKSRNNHFWFNFGNTTTDDTSKYDDKNPNPKNSDGIAIDVSGRDISEITFSGNDELLENGAYKVNNIAAIKEISDPVAGEDYWSNDGGKTLVAATDVHPQGLAVTWPTSVNSGNNKLYYLESIDNTQYTTSENAGWNPDAESGTKMSIDIRGNSLSPPLAQDDWMAYHGYVLAEIEEIDWMLREGYKPYQDVLHDKWFIIYNENYEAYYVQFHVTDNVDDVGLSDVLNDVKIAARLDPAAGNQYRKSRIEPKQVVVKLNRYDSISTISKKVVERINLQIPIEMLLESHPFYVGQNISDSFSAIIDESNNDTLYVTCKNYGKVQEPDIDSLFTNTDFSCARKTVGSLGYAQKVLDYTVTDSDDYTVDLETRLVGNCILLFNATGYDYPIPTPTTNVDEYIPHAVWFNLDENSLPPAGPGGKTDDLSLDLVELWSYDVPDEYEQFIKDAFDGETVTSAIIFSSNIGATISYQFAESVNNSAIFQVPFICTRPQNDDVVRVLQRDPGPIMLTGVPDQTCHEVNCNVSVSNLRPGISISPSTLRNRDYISDSIKFAIDDSTIGSARFSAEKRVIKNFAKFQVKCVAEQKNGKLFDYTDQVWLDPDPDVDESLAQTRPGGISSLSNYETNLEELFEDIPQKTAGGEKVWTRVDSKLQVIASNAGFDLLNPNYNSKNHLLWASAAFGTRTITTAEEQGLGYDEMQAAGWFDTSDVVCNDITEDEWMEHEGYTPMPAFTHKIAKAAYFLLPHPEKNFYIWFDVGQISADPGDDGALDSDVGVDLDSTPNISYNGGAVRVAVDSYSNAGEIAKNLVNRINSDKYDIGKKFVEVSPGTYQQLVAGNLSQYFSASIDENDSSIVNIICKKSGLINSSVFNKNDTLNFPTTKSGDEFTVTLLDDGDTDYYVDITNSVAGFVMPPVTDVKYPSAPTGLIVSVNEIPHSPAQPGLSKTISEFIAYEDMSDLGGGHRKTLTNGVEVATGGPVSYIQDDSGSLIYPVIMSNASLKNPDQYDGVIEPLEIRSRASRNSPDSSFAAHDIRGDLQSDVAADSRRRANPIKQFVSQDITRFEPYEDGIEHVESTPAIDGFVRKPTFSGVGLNDLKVFGRYSAPAATGTKKYYIQCVKGFRQTTGGREIIEISFPDHEGPVSEVIHVIVPAHDPFTSNLDGKYFNLYDQDDNRYYVWFNVDSISPEPIIPNATGVEVNIATGNSATVIASAAASAIDALPAFSATANAGVITVTVSEPGHVLNASSGSIVDNAFSISITTEGSGDDNLGGKYFYLYDQNDFKYYVWFNVGLSSIDPAVSDATGVEVNIATGNYATVIASAAASAIDALPAFSATANAEVITVTVSEPGHVLNASSGSIIDNAFSINITEQGIDINDKFKWKIEGEKWSSVLELISTNSVESLAVATFEGLGSFDSPGSLQVSSAKTINVPGNISGYEIKVYARGDINSSDEYYSMQYFDEDSKTWEYIADNLTGEISGRPIEINKDNYTGSDSSTWNPLFSFSKEPVWHYRIDLRNSEEEIPVASGGSIRIRIVSSSGVTRLENVNNIVKIVFNFQRNAGQLELNNGLSVVFDNRNGHTSGDEWSFEAVSRSHEDKIGTLPLPGYLTWQESKTSPFVETSYAEQSTKDIQDSIDIKTYASATIAFNYPGYSGSVGLSPDQTWENVYLSSLNGQAFTLTDAKGISNRFEFDNDGELENDGQTIISLLRPEVMYIRFPDVDNFFQKRDVDGNLLWKNSNNNEFAAYSSAPAKASDFTIPDTVTNYLNYDSTEFQNMTEGQWASYYSLTPSNVDSDDICVSLPSVNEYAGKYFIITDAIKQDLDHINNTIIGGRYAAWFNVVDEDGNETEKPAGPTALPGIAADITLYWNGEDPGSYETATSLGWDGVNPPTELEWSIENSYYLTKVIRTAKWSDDEGETIICASPTPGGTGWNPDPTTKTMSSDSSGDNLWTYDSNITFTTAAAAGWDGVNPATEEEWAIENGYVLASLTESAWHEYHGYEDYSNLVPQYIEVKVKYSDTVKTLVDKTVRAIKRFKNKNKVLTFDCEYIRPPDYTDYLDAEVAGIDGTWAIADYDDSLFVKLEDDWFNQYSYDPDSPPIKAALERGWSRGYYTIKISSRNLGYHNISSRLDDTPSAHEPLYTDVPTDGGDVRSFTIVNDEETEWGGYKTFKELLTHTSDIINSSSLDIEGEVVYSDSVGPFIFNGDTQYISGDSSETNGIVLTDSPGFDYYVFDDDNLIADTLVRYPTKLELDSGFGLKHVYRYRDFLCGLRLVQKTAGSIGNTKTLFHHYNENIEGNLILSNFAGGTTSGPHIEDSIRVMKPATDEIRPSGYRSAYAGIIYENSLAGTDSIAFGGKKK